MRYKTYDKERILEELNIIDVATALGIELNMSSRFEPNGNGMEIKCPFHQDKSFGSTAKLVDVRNSKRFIGMSCWACGNRWNVIDMVMELKSVSFPDALGFLASVIGGDVSRYQSGGAFGHESHNIKGVPDPLSGKDLAFLGLNGMQELKPQYQNKNRLYGRVVYESDIPFIGGEKHFALNPDFDETYDPSFVQSNPYPWLTKEEMDKYDCIRGDFFKVTFRQIEPLPKESMFTLYHDDFLLYQEIVNNRALSMLNDKKSELQNIRGNTRDDVAKRFVLQKEIARLKNIGLQVNKITVRAKQLLEKKRC